jgi:8-oxo-dGTP pyrophosphatase MutT (NUDIX family)
MLSELGCITPKVGAVVGILRADSHLLVLQRPSGCWCLPCGYADIGETPEDTARRETLEETGLDITQFELLHMATTKGDESVAFMWEAIFLAHSISDKVLLSHEHLNAEWIPSVDDRDWHSTHRQHASAVFNAVTKIEYP